MALQMDSNSARSQIIDAHNATNDISSQVVENEDFPYRFAIFIDNWCGFRQEAVRMELMLIVIGLGGRLIKIQDLLNGTFK
jgi:hypothetical protein